MVFVQQIVEDKWEFSGSKAQNEELRLAEQRIHV